MLFFVTFIFLQTDMMKEITNDVSGYIKEILEKLLTIESISQVSRAEADAKLALKENN